MNIKNLYVYGNLTQINILSNYLNNCNIKCYYLKNINVKDKDYLIKRIINYILKNKIDAIYILDNTFQNLYKECKKTGIKVLNNRIFFANKCKLGTTIRGYLRIPILDITNKLDNYENLIIESLEKKYPMLIKSNDIIFQKLNNANEINIYKNYLKKLISYFNYENKIYLEEYKNGCRKIIVNFINNKELQILNYFEVLYVLLEHNIIIKSIKNIEKKKLELLIKYVKNIVNYFKLKFGYIEFIIDNYNIYFYKIICLDNLIFYDRNFIQKIYKLDLFDILIEKDIKVTNFNNDILIINEINFNYNDFFPFYKKKKNIKIFNNKTTHIKEIKDLNKDVLSLLKKTKNIFFKELLLKNINSIKKSELFIHNLYNKKDIFFIKILDSNNNNYFFKSNFDRLLEPYDKINSKISNFILKNDINDIFLEIKNNNIEILFYNKTIICVTGSKYIELRIEKKDKKYDIETYKDITIDIGDILILKRQNKFNLNYIAIKNGFKISKNLLNEQNLIRKNKIIFYNKFLGNSNLNSLKNNFIPKMKKKIKLNIIESSFTDNINKKIIDLIYKKKWTIGKKNENIILCTNNEFTKNIKDYYIKKKYIKYPRGTVLFNKLGLIIVNSLGYNYFEGISIFNIIDIDIWQLNYLVLNNKIEWNKVSLDYANYKNNLFYNFLTNKNLITNKVNYKDNINNTKLLLSKFFDEKNMINIEIRLMGDKHLIVIYKKIKKKINNDNYIEFAFRQKNINNLMKEYDIINGYDFYILKYINNIDKLVILIHKLENKISNIEKITNKIIKLPIVLNKKYFSDNKYLDAFLKINNFKNKTELKDVLDKMSLIIIEKNSIDNNISTIPQNPTNKLFLLNRNINQKIVNGLISIDNFFFNINYKENKGKNMKIFCKTLPIFNKNKQLFNYFDIIKFELVETKKFNSIYNHFILNKFIIDKFNFEFNLKKYKEFFNTNLNTFIKDRNSKINNYNKLKNEFMPNIPKNLINIHEIRSLEEYKILKIYIQYNQNLKFGEKICKVENNKKERYYIKSNMNGLITKIFIEKNKYMKENKILINILEY